MLGTFASVEKAALFVVSLGRFIGSEVLARLDPGELELLRMGLSNLGPVSPRTIEYLHREFYEGYQAADGMRMPVFVYLRRFLAPSMSAAEVENTIADVTVDMHSMARTLDFEHDRMFLFGLIRELEEARERIFPQALRNDPACESPMLRTAVRVVHRWPELSAKILQGWLSGEEPVVRPGLPVGASLSGSRRLAVFLRSLGPETAARLTSGLSDRRLRWLAFDILCADELATESREEIMVQATEALLHRDLIPYHHEFRAREIARLLSFPAWLRDLLVDLNDNTSTVPASGVSLPRTPIMRRELARFCSRAARRSPDQVFGAVSASFFQMS
jgi:hypothetical protein